MHSFIQRNKKKLLAVFGVLLMIVFLLPSFMFQGGNDPAKQAYGKTSVGTLSVADVEQANSDLISMRQLNEGMTMQFGFQPPFTLDPLWSPSGPEDQMPPDAIEQFRNPLGKYSDKPHLYALLYQEARAAGMTASPEEVEQRHALFIDAYRQLHASRVSGRERSQFNAVLNDPAHAKRASDELRGMLQRYLAVKSNFARVTALARSTPRLVSDRIADAQVLSLNIAEISADNNPMVSPEKVTDQKVLEAYEKYGTKPAGGDPMDDPANANRPAPLGYRRPERAKLQYFTLDETAILDAFIAKLNAEDLRAIDRMAAAYYIASPAEFTVAPATQPTTEPSTQPATQSATQPTPTTEPTTAAASTQPTTAAVAAAKPTTRPFSQVRADLRRRVLLDSDAPLNFPPERSAEAAEYRRETIGVGARALAYRDQIESQFVTLLQQHYNAYKAGGGLSFDFGPSSATAPIGPSANMKPAEFYISPEYPTAFADAFEKGFSAKDATGAVTVSLRPRVVQLANDWYTREKLAAEPGIGLATAASSAMMTSQQPGRSFVALALATRPPEPPASQPAATQPATQAASTQPATTTAATTQPTTAEAAATQPASPATQPAVANAPARPELELFAPSPLLTSSDRSRIYVFRLTDFGGGNAPPLEEVRSKIVADLETNARYDAAKAMAAKLIGAIASSGSPSGGIPGQVELVGGKLFVTGPISLNSREAEIKGYPLLPLPADATSEQQADRQELLSRIRQTAATLRARVSSDTPHPATMVELPKARKVLVLELRELRRQWFKEDDFTEQRAIAEFAVRPEEYRLGRLWFAEDAIVSRTEYKPTRE
jgi:hypothetical protein